MATLKTLTKITTLALSLLFATQTMASAMTLNGRVEEQAENAQNSQQTQTGTAAATAPAQSSGVFTAVRPSAGDLSPNSFPKAYQGDWACQTRVTDSTVSTVAAGQLIDSEISFYPTTDGRIQARWNQPGWVESQNTATSYGKNEAKSDRTTYFFGENSQGSWAARARDQYTMADADTIKATSYVDQYVDGQYTGRYRTVSVLKRTSENPSLANR